MNYLSPKISVSKNMEIFRNRTSLLVPTRKGKLSLRDFCDFPREWLTRRKPPRQQLCSQILLQPSTAVFGVGSPDGQEKKPIEKEIFRTVQNEKNFELIKAVKQKLIRERRDAFN